MFYDVIILLCQNSKYSWSLCGHCYFLLILSLMPDSSLASLCSELSAIWPLCTLLFCWLAPTGAWPIPVPGPYHGLALLYQSLCAHTLPLLYMWSLHSRLKHQITHITEESSTCSPIVIIFISKNQPAMSHINHPTEDNRSNRSVKVN